MVDAVTTANNAAGRINAGQTMLASNFETFLSLLTAQLKNQDPLSPVDSNQFTAQLTQMAGVEQQLLTNELLKGMLAAQGGGLGDAADFIGKEATAAWPATRFQDGQASWSYELAGNAASATLQVVNGAGQVVWQGDAPDKTTGVHDFTWDGETTTGGNAQEDEVYTLKVVAKDAAGGDLDAQVLTRGRVSGVEMYDGEVYLTVGAAVLPMSSVIALEEASSAPVDTAGDDESLLASVASAMNPLNLLS
ncbi:MAG: flagellar hook capping protein [Caulobacterales bacterium RIFCSPHIGHO2_01_FULL_70_19]|nr:MAG: flagellar hook capping protein [Caulobacterales bacterium RIFCSPHIGHO2_01_FULL_70_19]